MYFNIIDNRNMEEPKSPFQDFIPEGEEKGSAYGDGFKDWVPEPEPQPQVVEEVVKKGKNG